jgi:hypothetical protein
MAYLWPQGSAAPAVRSTLELLQNYALGGLKFLGVAPAPGSKSDSVCITLGLEVTYTCPS